MYKTTGCQPLEATHTQPFARVCCSARSLAALYSNMRDTHNSQDETGILFFVVRAGGC